MHKALRRAAFFDRDGVLNVDHGYVSRPEQFEWVEGAPQAIQLLNQRGYLTIIVTNQSGIGRGFYDEAQFRALHAFVDQQLLQHGARVDGLYFCPHLPDAACRCRKPLPGMLLDAISAHDIDPARSFLVGDKPSDLEAASAAGVRGWLFPGGDLLAFVRAIVEAGAAP